MYIHTYLGEYGVHNIRIMRVRRWHFDLPRSSHDAKFCCIGPCFYLWRQWAHLISPDTAPAPSRAVGLATNSPVARPDGMLRWRFGEVPMPPQMLQLRQMTGPLFCSTSRRGRKA